MTSPSEIDQFKEKFQEWKIEVKAALGDSVVDAMQAGIEIEEIQEIIGPEIIAAFSPRLIPLPNVIR